MNTIRAWHWCGEKDGKPVLLDGRPLIVGQKLVHDRDPVLCEHGYHASERLLDAMRYAGDKPWLTRVDCSGVIVQGDDKLVASERVALWAWRVPDEVLRQFARECALSVIHLWDAPEVVRRYLETGGEPLRDAARAAAGDAAWAGVAKDAAWAAWDAAWDAARTETAKAATRAVAKDAARAARTRAAIDRYNANLESLVIAAAHDAGVCAEDGGPL